MIEEARTILGNRAKARAWLRRPPTPLDGEASLDRPTSDIGTRRVEAVSDRIAHGLTA